MNPKPAGSAVITLGVPSNALGALTPKRYRAAVALLEERSTSAAAKKAGVHIRSLTGWLREPTFQAALGELRREALKTTLARLQVGAGEALEVLRELLQHENAFARLQAAQTLLGAGLKVASAEEFEARMQHIEAQLAKRADVTIPPRAG